MEDPKKMLQDANGYLRTAQNGMFSGKNNEAVELLNKAEELGLLAKQLIPGDFQVESLFQKIEKMRKDLERKGVATRPGGNAGLPFEVQSQLNRIRDYVIRKELEMAKRELDSYYARFAGPMTNIPEIIEIKEHLQKLEAEALVVARQKADAERANADAGRINDELCMSWELKLRAIPYFDGTPHNTQELLFEKENFRKAQDALSEYGQVNFPGQKSISLESQVMEISQRLQMFPMRFADTSKLLADEVIKTIEGRMNVLARDTTWVSDPTQLPYFLGKNDLDSFSTQIEEIRPLFSENPQGIEGVNNAMSKLYEMNEQRKVERSKRITMKPEAMSGAEAEAPITAAFQAVNRYYPGATLLKAAVVKPWESKHTEDWADNTRTQWVIKNTNETSVQIAALLSDDSCKLFTLHVEKELQTDGSFGPLKSHIMFEDMADSSNFGTP